MMGLLSRLGKQVVKELDVAPASRMQRAREIAPGRYMFDAPKDFRVEVGVLDDGSVHFGTAPKNYAPGVGGTQGVGKFTGPEAASILRGVRDVVVTDAMKTRSARYVLEPQDERMKSLVQKWAPPPGYKANRTQHGVEYVRDPSQEGSSKLLAAVPAAIGGGLLSRWAMQPEDYQV